MIGCLLWLLPFVIVPTPEHQDGDRQSRAGDDEPGPYRPAPGLCRQGEPFHLAQRREASISARWRSFGSILSSSQYVKLASCREQRRYLCGRRLWPEKN